jgi:pyoverdine/dityrosine biosynthesis protein Dit1
VVLQADTGRPTAGVADLSARVLRVLLRYRRRSGPLCLAEPCPRCLAPHQARVAAAVAAGTPITCVLPGFPGKSPNPAKVLGTLPDLGERLALRFLTRLCVEIREVYPPGAEIIICSDGRVFSDVVGLRDDDVTAYQSELHALLIADEPHGALQLFHLDQALAGAAGLLAEARSTAPLRGEVSSGRGSMGTRPLPHLAAAPAFLASPARGPAIDYTALRAEFTAAYAAPLDEVRAAVKTQARARLLYRGLTRFLFEDADRPGQTTTRSARQRDARRRAYHLIQRSDAWSRLLAERFPSAVRLSIHPQPCGAEKLGLHLLGTQDSWLTPWHGVVVETADTHLLTKRIYAEEAGAELVHAHGRPSHFRLKALPSSAARATAATPSAKPLSEPATDAASRRQPPIL